MRNFFCHFSATLISIVFFLPPAVAQQEGGLRAPSPNNESFKKLRAQCEQSACSPGGGDACAHAAAILLGDAPPDEFWEVNKDQRQKIALRLLEKGTENSNLARARAYDLYSVALGLFGGSPDPYRANELMGMMTASGYPGAALRKARASMSMFAVGASQQDRDAACVLAKNQLASGRLDVDSKRIAEGILEGSYCASREPGKN
jgi:hypothetical protein